VSECQPSWRVGPLTGCLLRTSDIRHGFGVCRHAYTLFYEPPTSASPSSSYQTSVFRVVSSELRRTSTDSSTVANPLHSAPDRQQSTGRAPDARHTVTPATPSSRPALQLPGTCPLHEQFAACGHKRVGIRLKCTSTLWAFQHAENWSARAVCAVHCSRFSMNGMWLWCCIMSHVSLWCRASCQAYCQSSSQCQLWRIVGGCSDSESSIERTAGHCWRCGS
jgi:hypothetical protein